MAGEIQASFTTNVTVYVIIRNRVAQAWNTNTGAFETYQTTNYTNYAVSLTEQGTASAFYVGTFPPLIPPGTYSLVAKQQVNVGPAESDPGFAQGNVEWNGAALAPLSDAVTSGQIGKYLPISISRSQMVRNFPIYLKSAADHVTPLTSGICSGQIARDGSATFGPLQSGAFAETGMGWYTLQALTSGDLNADTIKLQFSAVSVGGGASDVLPLSFVLQKSG